jgi:hypothetical protein
MTAALRLAKRATRHNVKVMHRATTSVRGTPRSLIDTLETGLQVRRLTGPTDDEVGPRFRFALDVAALPENAKARRFYTPADNGLAQPWEHGWWCNPPFGRGIDGWLAKARAETLLGRWGFMLLPARVDAKWWRSGVMQVGTGDRLRQVHVDPMTLCHVYTFASGLRLGVLFWHERVAFDGLDSGAPFPTAVVAWRRFGWSPRISEGARVEVVPRRGSLFADW